MKKGIGNSTMKKLLKLEKPNLIIHIENLKCEIDANPSVYSEEEIEKLKYIIDHMSKSIWIDKTYVNFKGNRWKDSFIVEDKWYELLKIILKTDLGRKAGKKTNKMIMESLLVIAITYLYQTAVKFDYDPSEIDISFKEKMKFGVEYEEDTRTSWDF